MGVGEAPGQEEESAGRPFVGTSGMELNQMLLEAGIRRNEVFLTNVCRWRPPNNDIEEFIPTTKKAVTPDCVWHNGRYVKPVVAQGIEFLKREILAVKPNIILAFGNVPLWALTGEWGITKWRGSELTCEVELNGQTHKCKLLPVYHPAAILRQWEWRFITIHDLRKVALEQFTSLWQERPRSYILRPSFNTVMDTLSHLQQEVAEGPMFLSVDIETRAKHIACVGLAPSREHAICTPLMCIEDDDGYWSAEQETEIVAMHRDLLTHPNCKVIGQNFAYDSQYFARYWGFIPNLYRDTLVQQHVMFALLPKDLGFLSSMYCKHHKYWKDEGKNWEPSVGEDALWSYNCDDATRTFEVFEAQASAIRTMGLEQVNDFQHRLWHHVLDMMLVGVRIDEEARRQLAVELSEELKGREEFIFEILGHYLNPRSPKQMHALFYEDLNLPKVFHKKTKKPTLDDEALQRIATREPLLKPLVNAIADCRTLGVYKSTFVESKTDDDGRMRCSYNIAGTDSYRFSSSEDAFGSGMNMENLPSDKSKAVAKAARRKSDEFDYKLPNIRALFPPDPGYTYFDLDLDRADLQIVVWESDDEELKIILRKGIDAHLANAAVLANRDLPLDEFHPLHPNYLEHLARLKGEREFSKTFIHGTNYGGSAYTMARATNVSVGVAEAFQSRWFGRHPGIKKWQDRVANDLARRRMVTNKFGYRCFFFDRVDSLLPEALAWIPQSTVACVINRALDNVATHLPPPSVQILFQVHDSIAGQYLTDHPELKDQIRQHSLITIPYDDPLIIPVGIKTSTVSWGDCA